MALRDRLDRIRAQSKRGRVPSEIDAIAQRGVEILKGQVIDHAELLYDEHGLPK